MKNKIEQLFEKIREILDSNEDLGSQLSLGQIERLYAHISPVSDPILSKVHNIITEANSHLISPDNAFEALRRVVDGSDIAEDSLYFAEIID